MQLSKSGSIQFCFGDTRSNFSGFIIAPLPQGDGVRMAPNDQVQGIATPQQIPVIVFFMFPRIFFCNIRGQEWPVEAVLHRSLLKATDAYASSSKKSYICQATNVCKSVKDKTFFCLVDNLPRVSSVQKNTTSLLSGHKSSPRLNAADRLMCTQSNRKAYIKANI